MNYFLKVVFFVTIPILFFARRGFAQEAQFNNQKSITFGLVQPLLGGFNITYTQQHRRFLFAYSHGTMLNLNRFDGIFKSQSARDLNIDQITYISTGFDLGYRILPDLSIRGEWKWHLNDLHHPDGEKIQYQTITVGPSVYYQAFPFKKKESILKSVTAEFSIRWWPVVYSSLDNYSYDFTNSLGKTEVFTHEKGDLFFALSIGWTIKN